MSFTNRLWPWPVAPADFEDSVPDRSMVSGSDR